MNFGKFDRLVTLRKPTLPVQDAFGAPAPAGWVEVAKVYAAQKFGAGNEATQADQLTAVQLVTWQLRYRPDLATTWQLIYQNTIYEITAIAEIGRRAGLMLTTQARGALLPIEAVVLPPAAYDTALDAANSQAAGIVFAPASTQVLYFNELLNTSSDTVTLHLLDSSDGSSSDADVSISYQGQAYTLLRADGSLYGGLFPPTDQTISA